MSVYYYLGCRTCEAWTGVIGRLLASGPKIYLASDYIVTAFLEEHVGHDLIFTHEFARYPQSPPLVLLEEDDDE